MTESRKISPEPVAGWATDCRDKYAENHDSGYAGRICMADGNLAWAAVVSDGCGGSMEGLKVSALAIQAFTDAVRNSSLAELSDPAARDAWVRAWTKTLHSECVSRFKGGMATFCGAVLLSPQGTTENGSHGVLAPPSGGWRLFSLNVGDSQVLRLTGDGKCMGITPDAPPNNANVEGHNPIRVVGVAPKADFPLIDVEEFPLPANGPCWILAGSDGFFSKKRGKDELCIFSSGDFRDICLGGAPFQELPSLAIRRSLANAQKLGCAEMMDNATVAMLGFRVPPTNLAVARSDGRMVGGSNGVLAPPASGRASTPGEPQKKTNPPGTQGRASSSSESQQLFSKPYAIYGAIAAAALVLGLIVGRMSASAGKAGNAQESTEVAAVPAAPADYTGVPEKGRCRYCFEHRDSLPAGEDPFHWANKCPRHDKWAGK